MFKYFSNFPQFYSSINSGIVIILVVWSIFWKGLALWRAARNKQKYWFVAILIFSTIGILDIAYIAFFQKPPKKQS
ncbi:hypothetical protein A2685_00460 [Candidatus Woesebacteria bacterium RIFCSPHIGHO2_01_FULL_37_10]|uniref:DUF5652 domain-containing protein n=1 Tax=Candidatus Woesebacteria bacterium RIFCSPHIGHO2_01_FULL_37_10 TaxID=1802489 RepID=A0A1F7XVK8_9BACT|nr:MAG: hypothetical protein A2685_00460 [Candidatus Woesebacteria bacterium RIFCSPHIGHO2_01_FULL_37_10]